jgi:CRISPR/Cas system-associated exonuclease Cas4 (RecB family)
MAKKQQSKPQTNIITLSPREIGKPLLEDFCPRCFWFTKKFPIKDKHPFFSPYSGLPNIVDNYIKRVVKFHLQRLNFLPSWLLNQLKEYYFEFDFENVRLLKEINFQITLFDGTCVLSGRADEILEFPDGSLFIIDYKTSSLTENKLKIKPLYEAQLNAYAYLANKKFEKPVVGLALVYFDPDYKNLNDEVILHRTKEEFLFGFNPTVVPVKLMDNKWVEDLCQTMFEILSLDTPPEGKSNCEGCNTLKDWLRSVSQYAF